MITITRSLARRLKTVIRQSLSPPRNADPPVFFSLTGGELTARAACKRAAIEYRAQGDHGDNGLLTVPLKLLGECAGHGESPVTLQQDQNLVLVRWNG
ncbi:MAG: hypothetical protein N2C14_19690, partial [Planctomycetales bacterium]